MSELKEKPFVVIDNPKVRITDLLNGTSEFFFKESGQKFIYTDEEIRASMKDAWGDKYIASILHRVGATREYSE